MPRKSALSKGLAVAFVVLTVSAIGGMISMMILFEIQTSNLTMTELPTVPTTTLAPPPVMRLPRSLIPDRYQILLHPHFYSRIVEKVNVTTPNQTLFFNGSSTVFFRCHQPTKHIFLHSFELNVTSLRVTDHDKNDQVTVLSHQYHEDESDFLEIELGKNLETDGNYSLSLSFEGEISEYLQAMYVSKYTETNLDAVNDTIQERFLVATNLEPTSARRLFPCFDEPDMKAVFELTVIHRVGTFALSNTVPERTSIMDEEWKYTQFNPTPKMSSYLLAFTISEFEATNSPENRVKIRTYARPEAIAAEHTDYAARTTAEILEFYERHFEMQFGLENLDQVALPDLEPLAMENWGLITYQEGALLYEEGVSSWLHKEVIATIIAHELAHQWFGNQVTMKWWNDVWLNEGFATYMSYLAVDHAEPSFQIMEKLIMDDLHAALEEDALLTSHPLSAPPEDVQTTGEILGMFDAISYSKGAMVLRMLADYVGEKVFDDGIRAYLKAHRGGNVEPKDLWDFIENARYGKSNKKVPEIMENWTNQMGYPVLTIDTTSGAISQKHFLYNSSAVSSLSWDIPVTFTSNISGLKDFLLDKETPDRMEEFISKKGEWFLVNVNATGYYRVNYNQENWERLLWQLETNPSRIPLMNRAQLIDDAFNLARAKQVDVTLALKLTRFLRKETAYLPWESAVRNLEYFILMFDRSEVYGPMQLYLRHQVEELYDFFKNQTDTSTVPEDHSLQHNQITAIEVSCSNGLSDCVEMVTEKFADWMEANDTNNIHTNLRSVIYCQAVAAGGKKEWEFAWEKFQSSTDTSEKDQLRKALSCTKKTWLLNRYLSYTLDPDKIRLMDVTSTINLIAQNAAGQALAWNFMRAHWDYVSQGDAASLVMGVTRRFSTQFELQELIHFRDNAEMNGAYRATLQAIEQTQVNIQWVKENHDTVLEWFERETADLE
ncbi:alanyl (membrane) aminopeptidase-like b [Poeciliopsis prolifica]|uniref:alanyl (membrane) aminopeptidase-like b n=1 Tax=Poeciliopsis prolifica TaxID=188132 RepID=UPI0024132A32|nr:alanyl (membrane) aminopeptidase-like b [Poeciliopsis prolifica]